MLEPPEAVTVVAVLGAVSHAIVAVMRAVQDYRVALIRAQRGDSVDNPVTPPVE